MAGSSRADHLVARAPEQAWKRRSAGDGAKGRRLYDWAVAELPVDDDTTPAGWQRWLLVRRQITSEDTEPEPACSLCFAPAGTTDDELVSVAGARWAIEECFQTAKNEVGLDHYQVRRYDAWYRHITLAMLAAAFLAVTAATAPKALEAGSSRSPAPEIRRLLAHLIHTPPSLSLTRIWSGWRRRHQYRSQQAHYQRRHLQHNEVLLEYQ
ncbi:SRSO17 transposase [Haloactinomyces albus]|uniref:SRSO17 transposase n=1 Tax=Haloactinomyces albus TaxID=1352928 RepID=A0AAE4CME1_9ACTN|nr:SRSO17 transposase [Haloactinomyces albus]